MSEDWYVQMGRKHWAELDATWAQAQADLQAAKASGYDDNAAECIQTIADCNAAQANLRALLDQYLVSQNPPRPPEPSAEERKHRDWTRMDWTDVVDLARQSKYARDIRPDDPGLIAGWQEAQRRRGRGE